MRAFVVFPNETEHGAQLLKRLLEQLRYDVTFVDGLEALNREGGYASHTNSIIIVPAMGPLRPGAAEVVKFAETAIGRGFVVYVADDMSAEAYKSLLRTGVGEWVTWATAAHEIVEISQRLRAGHAHSARRTATIAALLPSGGGVGNTTIALESAVYLASLKSWRSRRICVVDFNFHASALGDYIDVEPRFGIEEIYQSPDRLDGQMIDIFASNHESGVSFFVSHQTQIDYAHIDQCVIFALLDQLGERYDLVLVDLPALWFPWIDNIVSGSNGIVLTCAYGVPSVKQAAVRLRRLTDAIAPKHLSVAVNFCERGWLGGIVRRSDISAALDGQRVFYVQRDTGFAAEATNTGRPMMRINQGRGVCKDIRKIADWIDGLARAT
ncbi:hypothetical protein QNA08_13305 [Chelatococcus sp. SYSU_G07232]|uniref:AAA domain-containing protein n=1 Tax=Chelatococcus albus TaxID=3047466 RepID=A0ABT7AIK8_9HYPH|nr:hypothetical protein [Chelatococcus sp. SYSU_G07232]MDJ1159213.1 hypothetical protein [Chelatococcus sp. SYSU_G07232]